MWDQLLEFVFCFFSGNAYIAEKKNHSASGWMKNFNSTKFCFFSIMFGRDLTEIIRSFIFGSSTKPAPKWQAFEFISPKDRKVMVDNSKENELNHHKFWRMSDPGITLKSLEVSFWKDQTSKITAGQCKVFFVGDLKDFALWWKVPNYSLTGSRGSKGPGEIYSQLMFV